MNWVFLYHLLTHTSPPFSKTEFEIYNRINKSSYSQQIKTIISRICHLCIFSRSALSVLVTKKWCTFITQFEKKIQSAQFFSKCVATWVHSIPPPKRYTMHTLICYTMHKLISLQCIYDIVVKTQVHPARHETVYVLKIQKCLSLLQNWNSRTFSFSSTCI